jgi:hypothetical protein
VHNHHPQLIQTLIDDHRSRLEYSAGRWIAKPPRHRVLGRQQPKRARRTMSVMRWWHRIVGSRRTARILPLHQSHEATVASGVDHAAA